MRRKRIRRNSEGSIVRRKRDKPKLPTADEGKIPVSVFGVLNKIDERKRQAAIEAESHSTEDEDAWKPKQIESGKDGSPPKVLVPNLRTRANVCVAR